ncbi:MAG TPA: hypothetical protein VF142_01085 [Longimicrobium sp.]
MSFDQHARKVRDPNRSPWRRLSSLRGCVSRFCRLTRLPYRDTLEGLGLAWSPVPRDPPTDDVLRRTLDGLERARNRYLSALRGWETRRVRAKLRGGRRLSRAEADALAELRQRILPGAPGDAPG